jgi:hypothetical protein
MKPQKSNPIIITLALLALSTLNPQLSASPLGTAFSYQGKLASGGAQDGSTLTTNAVPVTNGLFTVALDFGAVFDGNARWLDISVKTNGASSYTTLAPRQPLTPTPYALYAPSAGLAASASSAGSVAAANIIGTMALAQLPAAVLTNNASGVRLAGDFSGNGGSLTNLEMSLE